MNGRPILFREVLFDRFPDGSVVLGGAPFNVAWNLQALGLSPLLISRIGDDDLGNRILVAMKSRGMAIDGVQLDRDHPTGTVEVSLQDGQPEYDIATGRAYDFIAAEQLPRLEGGGILYHGSLALRTAPPREALSQLRRTASGAVLADINLRPPWWDRETADELLQSARWVKLNEHELADLEPDASDLSTRAGRLLERTGIRSLVVTRGASGAAAFHHDGSRYEPEPPAPATVVDTVGAGDAFTSVIILGLTRGWDWPNILERAQRFAAAVVGIRGATSPDPEFYAVFRSDQENR